ncbi:Chalcone isomerase [Macleaya cordata]|uniref:Chalcone isomerase n=1 Tax=Macleaya cordata TaxID=56857 RepID=A0A200QCW9_MACCD|nr:Chalcone isomerase [Macleaya cordata]
MPNNWLFFLDLDGESPYNFPTEPVVSGSLAVQEAFNCISKLAGALTFWFASGSNSILHHKLSGNPHGSNPGSSESRSLVKRITSCEHNLAGLQFGSRSRAEPAAHVLFGKFVRFTMRHILKEVEQLRSFSVLSLAAALVPPFDNLSLKVHAVPLENADIQINGLMDQRPCMAEHRGSSNLSFHEIDWTRHAVEPRTGIEFPTVLDNNLAEGNNSSFTSEVLVGTGFRSMRVIKFRSVKVYAFGLYVHPDSLCEKLGWKYASVPTGELNNCPDFLQDLLREDIDMTVRLVVNCNGLKINTVRDAFEKSLRARLLKMNPNANCHCLRTFGSYFTHNIPLPAGTTIDFRRTVDGQLITRIGGKQIGAVHSKDLCRAFFDMYIGDVPVSVQAKEEICRNVGSILRRC